MSRNVIGLNTDKTVDFIQLNKNNKIIYRYTCHAEAVFGLGERYCSVNHKGKTLVNRVIDHFTQQKEDTYFPLPFFHTSDGHGVFVNTMCEVTFRFGTDYNEIELMEDVMHEIIFYYGTPSEIIAAFVKQTGKAVLPPKWAFGVWASANRWNCQKHIEEQLEYMEKNCYPVSVIVIEAWSDEATFYLWNGAKYQNKSGDQSFSLKDFTFLEPWPDPMKMINQLHEKEIRLVLWQCPVIKLLEEGQTCKQHDIDCDYAVDQKLTVQKEDTTPYKILRQWFIGSMVPDFTNPDTIKWWSQKRRYLLEEMQIDGFKTDGGEFIHEKNAHFYNGRDGQDGSNPYPADYEQAFRSMVGENKVLFSRAGYIGAQKTPMHWAGDQLSQFNELRSQLNAGLSLSLSGIPFWSFDIGGFAGALPDKELYLRSTALAAFVPAMQWHSEPVNGQFEEILKGSGGINDRSPWNMSEQLDDLDIIETARFFANLHMNFLPHFYNEACKAVENHQPLMRHLILDYSNDSRIWDIDDEYMIGDLLIAPVVTQGSAKRDIYLPNGDWYDLWSGECIKGSRVIEKEVPFHQIPLYLRGGGAVALNLDDTYQFGSYVGNTADSYHNLCIITAGENINYHFEDNQGNKVLIADSNIVNNNSNIKMIAFEKFVS